MWNRKLPDIEQENESKKALQGSNWEMYCGLCRNQLFIYFQWETKNLVCKRKKGFLHSSFKQHKLPELYELTRSSKSKIIIIEECSLQVKISPFGNWNQTRCISCLGLWPFEGVRSRIQLFPLCLRRPIFGIPCPSLVDQHWCGSSTPWPNQVFPTNAFGFDIFLKKTSVSRRISEKEVTFNYYLCVE